jgi:hypothetical protein
VKYKVLKPIPADDGSVIPSGTIVEADGWRNVRQLENGRYLMPVIEAEDAKPAAKPVEEPVVESSGDAGEDSSVAKPRAKKTTK